MAETVYAGILHTFLFYNSLHYTYKCLRQCFEFR